MVCLDEKSKQLVGEICKPIPARRTKTDFAEQVRELVDVHYPRARRITLVMDNLRTHRLSSLYETFAPAEALRLIKKIEPGHTPKHGRGPNRAEYELSVLEKQILGERIGLRPSYETA